MESWEPALLRPGSQKAETLGAPSPAPEEEGEGEGEGEEGADRWLSWGEGSPGRQALLRLNGLQSRSCGAVVTGLCAGGERGAAATLAQPRVPKPLHRAGLRGPQPWAARVCARPPPYRAARPGSSVPSPSFLPAGGQCSGCPCPPGPLREL